MPPEVSSQWREKASGFFSSSGVRLKQAGQSAGTLAKNAGVNVADAAGKVGSLLKNRWTLIQQSREQQTPTASGESIQQSFLSAATSTGELLRKGLAETKKKAVIGKLKVEEAAKKTTDHSKNILNNIERWQKGVASTDVFGVPLEVTVQRQKSTRPVPQILVKCAESLIMSGLNSEYLFKTEGDRKVVRQLITLYNQDWNASLPEATRPVDVAALIKCYLASLPEPLATFNLYQEIRNARNSIHELRDALKKLPNANFMTLEFTTSLLLQVSQKSLINKMDAHSLSMELAPVILRQKGDTRADFYCHFFYTSKDPSATMEQTSNQNTLVDYLDEDDNDYASSQISLDDVLPPDYGAIEVIQCLIEHHNAIFTDANETTWR
ncbi:putative Rho GTPase-activating protein At5g61530 [Curcuma longa]|uniref:putative Rho GTPase-activating protein At5g61530 n=1 Tax=Curcuma longa TaxID=136217 RepID=UPI003D9E522A